MLTMQVTQAKRWFLNPSYSSSLRRLFDDVDYERQNIAKLQATAIYTQSHKAWFDFVVFTMVPEQLFNSNL
jgi:hypothetical protein